MEGKQFVTFLCMCFIFGVSCANSTEESTNDNDRTTHRIGIVWFFITSVFTIVVWQFPFGNYFVYPFTILATWYHEMAHGIVATILGGNFRELVIFSNGNGYAVYTYPKYETHQIEKVLRKVYESLIAAAGPLSGPVMGSFFIMLNCQSYKTAQFVLIVLSLLLILSTIFWIRCWFGCIFIPLLGVVIFFIATKAPYWVQGFVVELLGTQAIISTYHDINYLFVKTVENHEGKDRLSDTGVMEKNMVLPHWFWGMLMAFGSFALLIISLNTTWKVHLRYPTSYPKNTIILKG